MEAHQKKTTMSVAEMRKMLGLKKTESYWLIHKNQFETITVCGKMRIVLDSFENWYANQVHYKKINGEAPGKEIRKTSLSIRDLSELLGLNETTVRDMIVREKFNIFEFGNHWRIDRAEFYDWYRKQKHYRVTKDRERDQLKIEKTMTLPEMGRLLCVDRNTAYAIVERSIDLVVIKVAGTRRVTKDSFEYWYSHQDKYRKFEDRAPEEQSQILKEHKSDFLGKELRRIYGIQDQEESPVQKTWYNTKEAARILKISESAVTRLARIGELKARMINGTWFIFAEDVQYLAKQNEGEQEVHNDGIDH